MPCPLQSTGPELFIDFFRLQSTAIGSFTFKFLGKSYHVGDRNPLYRPIVMVIKDHRFFPHVITYRNLGLGEAFMKGWYEFEPGTPERPNGDLYDLASFFCINHVDQTSLKRVPWTLMARAFATWLLYKLQGHKKVIDMHYGENPEMYRAMLGGTQTYTCGYVAASNSGLPDDFRRRVMPKRATEALDPASVDVRNFPSITAQDPDSEGNLPRSESLVHPLDTGGMQNAKYDRICQKLQLRPGQRLLDIGCGYGGFIVYAAKHYGVHGIGFAVTEQMVEGARANAKQNGVADVCSFHCSDLKFLTTLPNECVDAIGSIGVFEHVHEYEYPLVFDHMRRILKPDGLVLLHMLCSPEKPNKKDAFIQTYIFPNSHQNLMSDILHEIEVGCCLLHALVNALSSHCCV